MRHVVVLHHGINGTPCEMDAIAAALKLTNASLVILNADSNSADVGAPWYIPAGALFLSKNLTQDGIRECGKRLAQFIKCNVNGECHMSFVGYSFGGLVARACVAELHTSGFLTDNCITLNTFVTLGTPHLGISDLPEATFAVAGLLLGDSGEDLRLANSELFNLAVSKACIESLRAFERIICYGCTSDMFVSETSSLVQFEIDPSISECGDDVVVKEPVGVNMSPDLSFFDSFTSDTAAKVRHMYLALRELNITSHAVAVPKSLNGHGILVGKPLDDPTGTLSRPILQHLAAYFTPSEKTKNKINE